MIENRIEAIESTIETARNIPSDRKAELLKLVSELKSEVRRLAETHHDEASSITRFGGRPSYPIDGILLTSSSRIQPLGSP